MEEMTITMTTKKSHENHTNPTTVTTSFPIWKLYENPFYYFQRPQQQPRYSSSLGDRILSLRMFSDEQSRSLSSRRVSSDLNRARAQIEELKAEIELERRMRRKAESLNKRLARENLEERKGREATERLCKELAEEIVLNRAEIEQMKREIEEERKMLRIAEVWREERVQMKLADARVLMEEKIVKPKAREGTWGISDLNGGNLGNSSCNKFRSSSQRKRSPEAENPHIRRGIKGFVEFHRVLRAMGSKERQLGSKLECQKAQLRVLLTRKNAVSLGVSGPDSINLLIG